MEHLRIEHESGYLDLYVDAFFPCPLKKATKVFRLINRWCPPEVRQELMAYLCDRAELYQENIDSGVKRLRLPSLQKSEEKELLRSIQEQRRLLRRLQRNMELLEVS